MKRKSESVVAPVIEKGHRVKLDQQPFEWEVLEVGVDGFQNRVKIRRYATGEIVDTVTRTVDDYRLTPLEG